MKNMCSQIIQMFFAQSKRSLVVSLFMMITSLLYAGGGDDTGIATLTVYGQLGQGKVYLELSEQSGDISSPSDDVAWTEEVMSLQTSEKVNSAYFGIHAKANVKYYFEGWYSDEKRTQKRDIQTADSKVSVTGSNSENYYANFARIISISDIKAEKIFVWTEGSSIQSSRAKVVVPVHAAQDGDVMTIDIIGSGDEYLPTSDIRLYNADNAIDITSTKQITRSADGTFVFYVGYQGSTITDISVLLQKKIGLKVVAKGNPDDRDWEVFDVTIAEAPILTFKGTNGKGTYSSNLFSTFDTNSNGAHEVAITNASMLSEIMLNLSSDPTDGEIFYGWKVTKVNGTETYISYNESCTAPELEGGETVEAVFISNTCGFAVMNGRSGKLALSDNTIYSDLHLALIKANELYQTNKKKQYVVFDNLATLFTKSNITRSASFEQPSASKVGTLQFREGGYTIHKGVTLLIPGDNTYKYTESYEITSSTPTGMYRKMIVAPNTKIYVNYGAEIIVYAKICALNQTWAGIPFDHGQIELGMGSEIILGDPNNDTSGTDGKAKLNVLGYVTNSEEVVAGRYNEHGKVIAYKGAYTHEILQYTNWRGGTAAGDLAKDKRVFAIPQYYIQNIEAPAIFYTGAEEEVTAMANVSSMALNNSAKYIGTGSDGFFALGDKVKIIKYYDRTNDKQKYIIEGESASESTINFNNISLSFGIPLVLTVDINSSDYDLPISSNFDVELNKATINFKYDIIALPGVSLLLGKDAVANILEGKHSDGKTYPATMYVYDKEQAYYDNGTSQLSYMGSIGTPILQPLFYTPYGSQTTTGTPYATKGYKRTHENANTTIDIRGILNVGKDYSSTSVLYTTAGVDQIISDGEGGKIKFYNIDNGQTLKISEQYVNGVGYINFPVTNAVLTNADGSTVTTASAAKGTLYTYTNGKWIPSQKWTVNDFEVTLPEQSVTQEIVYAIDQSDTKLQGKTFTASITGAGFEIVGDASLTFNTNEDLKVQVKYTAQNKHNLTGSSGVLTLNNADYNITYTTELKAIENYTPKFTITTEQITMPLTYVDGLSEASVQDGDFQINTTEYNVTSLIDDMKSECYKNLTWEWESTNPAFTFVFGEERKVLSDAKIIFEPSNASVQTATLTLIAKYRDANNLEVSNEEQVTLTVTAEGAYLVDNKLKITDNCIAELADMCVNVPVTLEFEGLTANTKPLRLSIENNGSAESPIIQYTGTGTVQDPFVVTANTVPTTKPTIRVTQDPDYVSGYASGETEYQPTIENCYPDVEWNWNEMYFGRSYDNPITTNSTGAYTLRLKSVTKDGTSVTATDVIVYDSENNTATIMPNLTGEYVATFEFEQDAAGAHIAYTQTFEANIYSAPNILPLCVNSERVFTAATSVIAGDVKYNAIANEIAFQEKTSWTMTFIGVPDILSFTPTTNTQLTIEQSENGSSYGIVFYSEVATGENYQVELSPATKFVRFTVVGATTLADLCLTELNRVRISPQILYIPISNDPINNPTKRTITVTYASEEDIDFRSSDANITTDPQVLTQTADGEYRVMNVTVSSAATAEYNTSIYVQHPIGGVAEVDIETYRFPQKLPIQLESGKDEAKRFYFVTDVYKNSEWDAEHYAIKMQNKTSTEDNRPYVTFVFDGAPSFLRFAPIGATNVEDWLIEEGVDANSLRPTTGENLLENGVLKQNLEYTSRCVCVTYIGASTEVVQMTNVNILSDQSAIPNPEELTLTEENKYGGNLTVGKDLTLTVVNLTNLSISIDNPHFTLSYGTETPATTLVLGAEDIQGVFGEDMVSTIPFKVFWDASLATDFGSITFSTEIDGSTKTLATVPLVGTKTGLAADEIIYTGVKPGYTLNGPFGGIYQIADADEKSTLHRPVDLSSTYDKSGKPLFDYLIIYGETSTTDGSTTITTPTTTAGSNANTPVYVYVNDGDKYKFAMIEENANSANKMLNVMPVASNDELRIYMTGFCPYATTGYTKEDEGVWYFQGENGAKLHIYLEDCYLYSRYKTVEGRAYNGRFDGQAFSESYVRGSGGVMVFENNSNDKLGAFDVTIHTKRYNMLKSHYGCFFELMQGMRAYQVSSPIQVHLASENHQANSVTTITFDDKWPIDATDYNKSERTNGFLSLQKQVNNAPSIDLGNANTIINFKGGQVELQNAAVVSPNYKTTLAISFRSGLMAGFPMALGIGTDDVGGQVHFYDGTTTVIPMYVDPKFKDYYLLDTDAEGQYITSGTGDNTKYLTSCLRCPTHTRIYGGSHCMMRACEDVTSKGGAPMDENGALLGIYKYPKIKQGSARGGFRDPNAVGLVIPTDISDIGYNAESVTPNANGTVSDTSDDFLNFWFTTDEESSVKPEVDKTINFWKACMTEISAEYMSYGGTVGGETKILPTEDIKYLLYCQIDENISNVITAGTGDGDDKVFTYEAPVKDPTGQLASTYLKIRPQYVGEEWQNYIETIELTEDGDIATGEDYTVTDKVYYVVPTTADTWMSFTAPFNVEKLWVVETYDEEALAATPNKEVVEEDITSTLNHRESVLLEQAKHNADFAAFFGVAMALGRDQTFEEIYNDYIGWAEYTDKAKDKRGKIQLQHYDGTNFSTANYYLYKNNGYWEKTAEGFKPAWEVVGKVGKGDVLMEQGETYSLLFPYCTGCDVEFDENGNLVMDENGLPMLSNTRDYWDYWSGKFLIFESTQATTIDPHVIKGSLYHENLLAEANDESQGNYAILKGNSTFAELWPQSLNVYTYTNIMNRERFEMSAEYDSNYDFWSYEAVQPTVSFLIANIPAINNMPAKSISRDGKINYGKVPSGVENGKVPTIGGGNDIFVTSIADGINIAVAAPQLVKVMSASGSLLFNGWVDTSVDVTIPGNGIYVVAGENTSLKILH